ncbi:MAG: hypothetical protein FWG63_02255 [Defluviitaleaceae bacterium]|nr:hypothetical protein [Defluviitaleaceae bacterium]
MSDKKRKEHFIACLSANGIFWFIYGIVGHFGGYFVAVVGLCVALSFFVVSLDTFSKEKEAVESGRISFFVEGVVYRSLYMISISTIVNYFVITNVTSPIRAFIRSLLF